MIVKRCDICGQNAKPADNEGQANRNLGLHKRVLHRVASRGYVPKAQREKEKLYNPAKKEPLWDDKAYRNEYKRQWAAQRRAERRSPVVEAPQASAVPCKLDCCPNCGTRFYMMKGS
jgi:hypothetical protein